MSELSSIKAILFDTGGVLYHRPREDHALTAFLAAHGLKPRHREVLAKALRAAQFDAWTGRISRDVFYDAMLRLHGITDERLFPAGREAIYQDAMDIEVFPGVAETLERLYNANFLLGTVSDTVHAAGEKIAALAARGISPGVWKAFVVSSDEGVTKAQPALFARALHKLGVAAGEALFVGHATNELHTAQETGLQTAAFLPDDYAVETHYAVGSFYELADLLLGAE